MVDPIKMLALTILLMTFSMVQGTYFAGAGYYTAAVYEHVPYGEPPQHTMPDIIKNNLMAYWKVVPVAAIKGVDIIVFPESGIIPLTTRELYREYSEYIPDPQVQTWNPCKLKTSSLIAKSLSCLARSYNMYLVANMMSKEPCSSGDPDCPDDKAYLYNTNVVFNRNGELVARYRKYHLFFEYGVDIPKNFEYVAFETEFAKIGTFTCFDIVWGPSVELLKRYDVDTVAVPQYWIEYLPMYSSIQASSSWSVDAGVNLLVANAHQPSAGAVGSGVYLGASRIAHYVYELNGKSKLLVAKVPARGSSKDLSAFKSTIVEIGNPWAISGSSNNSGKCSEKILGPPRKDSDFRCKEMNLSNFTLVRLQKGGNSAGGCNKGLCCSITYNAVDMNEDYYLAVSNATLYIENVYGIWEEMCMVIRCDEYNGTKCSTFPTQSNTIFRELTMEANIKSEHVYSSVVTSGMRLLSPGMWSYSNGSLSLQTSDGLLFAVMNGRPFDRDPPYLR